MDLQIEGRKAVVLASSRGLGLAIAQALAAEGAHVLLTGRSQDALAKAADEINATGRGKADWVAADLAAEGTAAMLANTAIERLGVVDILVNNTGGPPPGTARDITSAALHAHMQAMVAPLIELTGLLIGGMCDRGWGRVLTVASSGVEQPIPNLALSNTLRSALVGWNKTLAAEVAASGVTCNMLLPGRIHTDRLDQLDAATAQRTGSDIEQVRAASRGMIPAGRYGRPAEFAAVAAFLCSGPASYVTGVRLRCDGGLVRSL